MPLFRRKSDSEVPAGLEPYYDQPRGWRLWVRRIVGLAAALLLLFLLVWAVAWVYRSVTDDGVDTDDTVITDDAGIPESDEGTNGNGTNGESSDETQPEETPGDDTDDELTDGTTDDTEGMPDTGDESGNDDVLPSTGG